VKLGQVVLGAIGWLVTAFGLAKSEIEVVTDPTGTTLETLIVQESVNEGPFKGSGGTIHKVTAAQAAVIAPLMRQAAKDYGLDVRMLAAQMRQESRFDPLATDPNNENHYPAGETPLEIFKHTDIGIAQFSGAGLAARPEFQGLSVDQMVEKGQDPNWAVPAMAQFVANNLKWASEQDAKFKAAGTKVLYPSATVLGFQAYNSGQTGALERATDATKGDFGYGMSVYNFYLDYVKLGVV
jgi:hypothetical protein